MGGGATSITVTVSGAPRIGEPWLRMTVFALPPQDDAAAEGETEREQRAWRVYLESREVDAAEFATPAGAARLSFPVPGRTRLVALIHKGGEQGASFAGAARHIGVAPLVSEPVELESGESQELRFDFSDQASCTCRLIGAATALEELDVSRDFGVGIRAKAGTVRVSPDADGRFRLLGFAAGTVRLSAQSEAFLGPVELVDAKTGSELIELRRNAELVLKFHGTYGAIQLVRSGVPIREPFRLGTSAGRLSAASARPPAVSLAALRRAGFEHLFLSTDREGLFTVALDELSHGEGGEIAIDLPAEEPASVEVHVPGDEVGETDWKVVARGQSPPRDAIHAVHSGNRWVFEGLRAGEYDIDWVAGFPPRTRSAPIARDLVVESGSEQHLERRLPELTTTHVVVANWHELPAQLRPKAVWIDKVAARRTDEAGVFEIDLARPLGQNRAARALVRSLAGQLRSTDLEVRRGDLHVSFPTDDIVEFRVTPRFGGVVHVRCYYQVLELMPFTGRAMRLAGRVRPLPGNPGAYLACSPQDDVTVCSVDEVDPASGERVFRGFHAFGGSEQAGELDRPGRWITLDWVSARRAAITAIASYRGRDYEYRLGAYMDARAAA